jgi:23S rRNA (adenine2503-C2)-methyltransferase
MDACRYYVEKTGRRLTFEWALIAGENDTEEQAHKLGGLLRGMLAHVNLIPLNPTAGYGGAPSSPERVARFQAPARCASGGASISRPVVGNCATGI